MPISTQKAAQPDAEAEALDPGQSGVEQQEEAGLTLDDYARAKALPVDFLKSLGVSPSTFGSNTGAAHSLFRGSWRRVSGAVSDRA